MAKYSSLIMVILSLAPLQALMYPTAHCCRRTTITPSSMMVTATEVGLGVGLVVVAVLGRLDNEKLSNRVDAVSSFLALPALRNVANLIFQVASREEPNQKVGKTASAVSKFLNAYNDPNDKSHPYVSVGINNVAKVKELAFITPALVDKIRSNRNDSIHPKSLRELLDNIANAISVIEAEEKLETQLRQEQVRVILLYVEIWKEFKIDFSEDIYEGWAYDAGGTYDANMYPELFILKH
jgi:hypothetical protein